MFRSIGKRTYKQKLKQSNLKMKVETVLRNLSLCYLDLYSATMDQFSEIAPVRVQAGPVGKEIKAVTELRSRVADIMWNDHAKGDSSMLRWLRAKKMDIDGAERMIKQHVEWRKKLNMDKLRLEDPNPAMLKKFWYRFANHSRNGNPVIIFQFGEWDMRSFVDGGGTRDQFDLHQGQMWEKALYEVEKVEQKMKGPRKDNSPVQYIMIADFTGFAYRQLASYTSLQFILSMVFNFENNYPEVIYYCYIINSDWVFEMLLRIIRPLMTGSIDKLKVYGFDRPKWEKVLRKEIDPKGLPYRYGGYSKKESAKLKLPFY